MQKPVIMRAGSPTSLAQRIAMSSSSGLLASRSSVISVRQTSGPRSSNSRATRSRVRATTHGNELMAAIVALECIARIDVSQTRTGSRVPGLLQRLHELLEPADMTAGPSQAPLRIAQVAPLFERLPPQLYGGTERVVSYLTKDLVRQGHTVTLFASGDYVEV